MAKSRKSKKTTDLVKQHVEAESDAAQTSAMPEDLDATLPNADTAASATESETTSDNAVGSVDAPEPSVEEALEATDKEIFESDAPESGADDAAPADDADKETVDAETGGSAKDLSEMSYEDALEATDAEIFDEKSETETETVAVADAESDEAALEEEPVVEEVPEPVAKEPPKPANTPAPPQQSSGGMWPAVFGGIVAALLGFIAGRGDQLDQYLPASMQRTPVDLTALESQASQLAGQAAELAEQTQAQQARIDALEAAARAEPDAVVVDNSEEVAALEATINALTERLAALESRPVVDVNAAPAEVVESLQAALDAQNAQIAELSDRAAAAEAKAAGEAARILARAALTRVVTAVDSGQSFAPALSDLEEVTPVEVPEPLRAAADAGVPTLAALQESFPDAARTALNAARSDVPESEVAGITGFLRRQLNVRSVVPREGDDPDAVLSRVQAAVQTGDLGTALTEIGSLPESAQTAMNDWIVAAEARKAAQDAANDLADSLNSN